MNVFTVDVHCTGIYIHTHSTPLSIVTKRVHVWRPVTNAAAHQYPHIRHTVRRHRPWFIRCPGNDAGVPKKLEQTTTAIHVYTDLNPLHA